MEKEREREREWAERNQGYEEWSGEVNGQVGETEKQRLYPPTFQ